MYEKSIQLINICPKNYKFVSPRFEIPKQFSKIEEKSILLNQILTKLSKETLFHAQFKAKIITRLMRGGNGNAYLKK